MLGHMVIPSNEDYETSFTSINISPVHEARDEYGLGKLLTWLLPTTLQPFQPNAHSKSIAIHPTRSIVAIVQTNIISIMSMSNQSGMISTGTPLNITRQRLNNTVLSLAWTHETQNSLLVGTSSGLFYITIPQPGSNLQFDASAVEIKPLAVTQPNEAIVHVAPSSHGRLFACVGVRNGQHRVYLGDAWLQSVQPLQCLQPAETVEGLYWMQSLHALAITSTSGWLTVVNTLSWEHEQYELANSSSSSPSSPLLRPIVGAAALLAVQRDSSGVAWLQVSAGLQGDSVLVRQAPAALRQVLSTDHLEDRVKVHNVVCNAAGSVLACTYAALGSDAVLPIVSLYAASHASGSLAVTYLRSISREEAQQTPLAVSIGSIGKKEAAFVFWSDSVVTYQIV
eukprot:gene24223-29293_t